MNCNICNNTAIERLKKGNTQYWQCVNCRTLFSGPLPNENMVGGGNEEARNVQQNHERVARIDELSRGMKKEEVFICDFGCGFGRLVKDLKAAGYVNTIGYDPYNSEFSKLPEKNKYHIITGIEIVEHTSWPYVEIDVIHRSLVQGGVCMWETSFTDIASEDGIELEDFFYIEPSVGHSTIFSFHGLDLLMVSRGFSVRPFFNRNVHLYSKK